MGRTFSESDFADKAPQPMTARTFSESDFADTKDAVAEQPNAPPPNPSFDVNGMSQTARTGTPAYLAPAIMPGPGLDISPTRALLTNEPTSGFVESYMRGLPAQAGALVAGTAAGAAGIAASPFTGGLSLAAGPAAAITAAGVGGAGMEAARQTAAQLYSGATGRPYTSPGQVLSNVGTQGIIAAGSQTAAEGLKAAGGFISSRLPDAIEHYFGPNAQITRYIRGRGVSNVLTPENMHPDAPLNALEGAQGALTNARKAAGGAVGAAEDALAQSGKLSKPVDVSDIAKNLRDIVTKKGFNGPDAAFAGQDAKVLNQVLGRLEQGNIPGDELLNLKRILQDRVSYGGGRVPEVGKTAEGVLKKTVGEISERINNTFPELGDANLEFSKLARVYDKYRQYLGGTNQPAQEILSDANALRRIRASMVSNPNIPATAVNEFDHAVAGSGDAIQKVLDTVAANSFNAEKVGRGAPSSFILKGASAVGLTSPYMAGQVLRGAEAMQSFNPAALTYGAANTTAATPLAQEYMRRKFAQ